MKLFIEKLIERKLLKKISVVVDSQLEITEIVDRVSKDLGPALLFENVKGYKFPVIINSLGSIERLEIALGDSLSNLSKKIKNQIEKSNDFAKSLKEYFPTLNENSIINSGTYLKNMLDDLPILKTWPKDGGSALSLPIVITQNPQGVDINAGIYRLQKLSKNKMLLHWRKSSGGEIHFSNTTSRMAVTVVLGGSPSLLYAASVPLPNDVDEFNFAGLISGKPLEILKSKNGLPIPSDANFIIEGYVEQGVFDVEGPFGNHTGYYPSTEICPILTVESVWAKEGAIYPATVVGKPPMEDCYLAKASEKILLPIVQNEFPKIIDINFPLEGVFGKFMLISIDDEENFDIKNFAKKLWNYGGILSSRAIVILDKEVDLSDYSTVFWKVLNSVNFEKDLFLNGGKIVIDATENSSRQIVEMDRKIKLLVDKRWSEYGF